METHILKPSWDGSKSGTNTQSQVRTGEACRSYPWWVSMERAWVRRASGPKAGTLLARFLNGKLVIGMCNYSY